MNLFRSMARALSISTGSTLWDRLGIGVSGLCAVHCLLMPAALASLPLWSGAGAVHAWLHPVFAALLVPITALAAWSSLRRGRAWLPVFLLGGGLLLVLLAWFTHEQVGTSGEVATTLLGSLLLVAGHWLNWRAAHRH